MSGGRSRHFAAASSSLSVICVAGWFWPGARRPHDRAPRGRRSVVAARRGSSTTGSASASGVPAQPPSANDRVAAEREQAAAAHVDEVLEHPLLLGRERGRLDAAENDRRDTSNSSSRVVGKPFCSSSASVDAEPQVLVRRVRRRLRRCAGAATTCRLSSASVACRMNFGSGRGSPSRYRIFSRRLYDVDERVALVVLRDFLVGLHRDPEAEHPRPDVGRLEPHVHRLRLRRRPAA